MRLTVLWIPLLLLATGSVLLSQSTIKNPHGLLKWDCQDCHTTESWSKMRDSLNFDHAATGFALLGAHKAASCASCHADLVFSHVGSSCVDCHADHHAGQLGIDCQNCHTSRDWQNQRSTLDLHAQRGFPLQGAHAVADCESCHRGFSRQEFAGTPTDCYGCHAEAFAATTDPDHIKGGFSRDCQSCHTVVTDWHHADFSHPAAFPLIGGHKSVACLRCHTGGSYTGLSIQCYPCHSADFSQAANPSHIQAAFPHDCSICHTIMGWTPSTFDHATTAFPLTGAHTSVLCNACHTSVYAGTPTDCYACHQTAFASSTNPNHAAAGFAQTCLNCHTTAGWAPSSYDHAATGFVLTGKHTTATCVSCHATVYAGTSPACFACHQAAYEQTTDPNHVSGNFDHDCSKCHSTAGWDGASFDHSTTGFALTGQHVTVACVSCHVSGYAGTPTDCYSCHQSNFDAATNPNHVQQGFGHDCTVCHTTSGWTPSIFDHAATAFPLTGAHTSLACNLCHASSYAGTPTECYSCHQTAYQQVTDPNHVLGSFDHNCTVCHSTAAWKPSSFDHSSTGFALTGAHTSASCSACHATQFAGTPTACYDCHQSSYDATTNPSHTAAGFPTACESCHNTTNWTTTTWNHDTQYFPIYSGSHQGRWSVCADCHVNASTYIVFECITCHTHNKTDTDSNHSGVSGYQYLSSACYACHPQGTN